MSLVEIRDVSKHYPVGRGILGRGGGVVRAVDGVSFSIKPEETFGLVGESGCGKTTLGRVILRLTPPTSGEVHFAGVDATALRGEPLRRMRRDVQGVFQDPLGSLNPRMTVGEMIGEPLHVFDATPRAQLAERVAELLTMVGLDPSRARAYPAQLSGGQRQRVGIARAIAVGPRFIVADEPVSALDVSVQAQILNLMVELRERLGLAYLFIAHGLAAVRHLSHRVGVMYLGRMVEVAETDVLFGHPAHPYTVALLEAAPAPDPARRGQRIMLSGEPPSATHLPGGCRFRTRCPFAEERCAAEEPPLREIRPGQLAACHFPR